ncbi:UDP-N-acetylmuramate dehydrogenase [Candidatus Uhrbacteria bacterium]|jgi:UDP-N-acetylmuramate dehydrogenase|nr:UDP-N-acetylmuramate dehydrogenase [Candidatus Uhrbacteria bacterium]
MNKLKEIFGDRFLTDEPLAKHLNFRIGGPTKYFVEVKTIEELQHALAAAKENSVETFVLGGGSNTLASDAGFDGLVIKLALRAHQIDGTTVVAEAGMISAALARVTASAGLSGFAWAISLPGTIGGAVRGNAGCFGGEMKDTVVKVEVLRNGKIVELYAADLEFGYRDSKVKHNDDIVLRVWLELAQGDSEVLLQQLKDTVEARKETQPLHAGSAGCIFKNFEFSDVSEIEKLVSATDVPEPMITGKRISAGWIIDQADLKGTRIGDSAISDEHGNFLINHGKATADEIVQLIALVKTRVRTQFGIQLQEEVQYLGF